MTFTGLTSSFRAPSLCLASPYSDISSGPEESAGRARHWRHCSPPAAVRSRAYEGSSRARQAGNQSGSRPGQRQCVSQSVNASWVSSHARCAQCPARRTNERRTSRRRLGPLFDGLYTDEDHLNTRPQPPPPISSNSIYIHSVTHRHRHRQSFGQATLSHQPQHQVTSGKAPKTHAHVRDKWQDTTQTYTQTIVQYPDT